MITYCGNFASSAGKEELLKKDGIRDGAEVEVANQIWKLLLRGTFSCMSSFFSLPFSCLD